MSRAPRLAADLAPLPEEERRALAEWIKALDAVGHSGRILVRARPELIRWAEFDVEWFRPVAAGGDCDPLDRALAVRCLRAMGYLP